VKATLTFDLTEPDERAEHRHSCLGSAYRYQVIDEILQYIRNKIKYQVDGIAYKDFEEEARRDWYGSTDDAVALSMDDVIQYAISRELEQVADKINECLYEVHCSEY